jgi:Flp pilus assembly protein TadB
MGWQYRPRSPADEAAHTLTDFQLRLRAAEASDRLEVNLGTEPPAFSRFNLKQLRNVAVLWTIVVFAIAGVATWFLDRLVAAEIVAVLTPVVIFMTPALLRRISDTNAAP